MKDKMIKQLKELEKERDKTNLELLFAYLTGRIEQLKLDIKIEIEELGEIIEFLEGCLKKLKYFEVIQPLIKELKQKKKELEESQ